MIEHESDTHHGRYLFPMHVPDSRLERVGSVGVDSASVRVSIVIGDLSPEWRGTFDVRMLTPEGDGRYDILAGKIKGLGRCIVVAFDTNQDDDMTSECDREIWE